jgi:molybdate transport system substrate-binding protein
MPLRLQLTALLVIASACGVETNTTIAMVPSSFVGVTNETDRITGQETEWIVAGSSSLVRQLADGAAADVLITADQETMARAFDEGVVEVAFGVIARNRLVLAVAPGNPAGINAVTDLANPELLIGVCASEVPCGRLAAEAATVLGVTVAADTEEPNVRALALKIARGELDAGLVYATDAQAFALDTIADESFAEFTTEYPAASVTGETNEIIEFLQSPEGQSVIVAQGFTLP